MAPIHPLSCRCLLCTPLPLLIVLLSLLLATSIVTNHQMPKLKFKLNMKKVLSAHSTLEIVVEVHQLPSRLRHSSEQPVVAGQSSQLFLFRTKQSTIETKFTYSTEFLYAFTFTSEKARDITGPYNHSDELP